VNDPSGPERASSLAAVSSTAADRLGYDLERLRLIAGNRGLGATWAMIGRADGGKPPKIAKRDFKRQARQAGRQWRLRDNLEG
jgi:hypothetical protein